MKMARMVAALVLGSASFAAAADTEPTADTTTAPFDWAGPYVGIQLGYGWGNSDFVDGEYNGLAPFPTVKWRTSSDGLLAGINAGHNWRDNNLVFGIEGEIGRLNLSGRRGQPGEDPVLGLPYDAYGSVDRGWYGGLSARLGYALERTLFYTKAGVVYSTAKLGFSDTCTIAPCGDSTIDATKKVGWGYQLGAGVEHAFTRRWTVKAEYAYMDFGHTTLRGRGVGGSFDGTTYNVRSDLSVHTVKIGLNYKF